MIVQNLFSFNGSLSHCVANEHQKMYINNGELSLNEYKKKYDLSTENCSIEESKNAK